MLPEWFYWGFNMSITASITGLLIMLFRRIKKIPGRVAVFLWAIPLLRMLFPIGLNSRYSLMSLLSKFATKTITVFQPVENVDFSMTNYLGTAETYFPITYKTNVLENIFSVASAVWIVGVLAILLVLIVTYCRTMRESRDAKHLRDNIFLSEKIGFPAVYGIIKPKIILPASYKDKELELILAHENTHIRSLDNLWRLLAIMITSVHWFNPFCWMFLRKFLLDIELACDERVLAKLPSDRTKEYAHLLLESESGTNAFASTLGSSKIRKRIENILVFKRLTWFSLVAFTILIGVIFYTLLTNAG